MQAHSNNQHDTVVGLDVGDKYTHLCVLDNHSAEVLESARIPTSRAALKRRFSSQTSELLVLEVGPHSRWISDLLAELGHSVLLANPRRVRLISQSDSKSDKADAETLARLGRADPKLLHPVTHRSRESQADLAVLRARDSLVRLRTALINHVRGILKSFGEKVPSCSSEVFARRARGVLTEELMPALAPLLDQLDELTKRIAAYDKTIDQLAEKHSESKRLTAIKGVGNLTALAFLLTLEDPHRFYPSRAVGSYLGLRPKSRESGESKPQLGITKAGDSFVRRLLIQASHYILGPFGPDSDLRRWGLKLKNRGGKAPAQRAAVAVARKLGILLHRLWLTEEAYEPLRRPEENLEFQTKPRTRSRTQLCESVDELVEVGG